MYVVGLTGGIGSGKSTVAAAFVARGAVLVDADLIAREVVEPGRPALAELAEAFGPDVIAPDGTLDRALLAARAFVDEEQRGKLNAITHPRIAEGIAAAVEAAHADAAAARDTERILILDVPLLVEGELARGYRDVIVVTAPEELRVQRLVEHRGMDPHDVRARLRAQTSDEVRLASATHVIDNAGPVADLDGQVDRVWAALAVAAAAATSETAS